MQNVLRACDKKERRHRSAKGKHEHTHTHMEQGHSSAHEYKTPHPFSPSMWPKVGIVSLSCGSYGDCTFGEVRVRVA